MRDPGIIRVELAYNFHLLGSLSVITVERNEEPLVSTLQIADRTAELSLGEEEVVRLVGIDDEMTGSVTCSLGHGGWLNTRRVDGVVLQGLVDHCNWIVELLLLLKGKVIRD